MNTLLRPGRVSASARQPVTHIAYRGICLSNWTLFKYSKSLWPQ